MESKRTATTYFIPPGKFLLMENALGNPDLIQSSVSSDCRITIVDKDNFPLDELEQWPTFRLTSTDVKLKLGEGAYHIYIVVPTPDNTETNTAFISYNTASVDRDGYGTDGKLLGKAGFKYYACGRVSARGGNPSAVTTPSGQGRLIEVDLGVTPAPSTLPGDLNEFDNIFQLDKVDASNPKSWLLTILTTVKEMTARLVRITGALVFGSGESEKRIEGVAVAADKENDAKVNDVTLATTAWVHSQVEPLDHRFLRKDQDDRTEHSLGVGGDLEVNGHSTFEGDLTVGGNLSSDNFVQGNTMGSGWSVYRDANGNFVVETDRMIVRKDMFVNELVVNQETYNKGSIIYVKAGCTITRVEEYENFYRCYYDNQGKGRYSGFVVGDQARCQRYDQSYKDLVKYYWRLVVGVRDDFVDLSKVRTEYEGSGVPEEGDDIAQLGNRTDKTRQSAIVISPDKGGSVVVWAGIDSFELSDRNMVGMGVNSNTGRAYLYGYGDMYFGDRRASSYMKYNPEDGLELRGSLSVGSKLPDGREVDDFVGNVDRMDEDLSTVKEMTDRDYTIWFFDYEPTLDNKPAVDWTTEEEKALHEQDMFYYREQGKAWRFESGNWVEITDQDTLRALELITQTRNELSNFDYLKEAMKDYTTKIEGGLLMTSLVAVQNDKEEVEAFLNGSDFAKDDTHGKLLLAGGIPEGSENIEDRAKDSTTRIYEDGHVVLGSADVKGLITAKSMNLSVTDGGGEENPTDLTMSSGFRLEGYYKLPLLTNDTFTELVGLWISPVTRVPRLCTILCNDALIEVLYYNGTIYNGVSQINISHEGGYIKASMIGHQYSEWNGQCWNLNIEKSSDVYVEIISHA